MAETKDCEVVEVMGRRWDTTRPCIFAAPAGLSLEDIVLQSIESAYRDKLYNKAQRHVLLKYARVRLNGVEKAREHWKHIFPQKGDRIEILHGVRGGGGGDGKNPLATILSAVIVIVAAALTWWAGGQGATAVIAGMTAAQFTTTVGIVAAGMLLAVNMLFPAKPPSLGGLGDASAEKSSPTYSINGGKNAHNIGGYVPLVLGRHRQTPPLGAKSWTSWEGEKQYFHMLVVWGHPDMTVSDFRIGDTALSHFSGVTHHFIQSTTGSGLKFFGKQYNEASVGAALTKKDGWVQRTLGEANDLSVDIEFAGGLTEIDQHDGKRKNYTVAFDIQYKPTVGGSWKDFAATSEKKFGETKLQWTQAEINGMVSVFYKDGKLSAVKRGQTVSGGIQIYPQSGLQYCYGCGVSCQPDGTKLKVTVGPGVFKKNNKVYSVGGGKTYTYTSYQWEDYGTHTSVRGGKDTVLSIDSPIVIGVNSKGQVVKGAGTAKIYPTKASSVSGGGVTWKQAYRDFYGYDYDYSRIFTGWEATIKSGSVAVATPGKIEVRAAVQKQLVRNYTQTGLPLKSYDVRIRRTTKDTDDSYIIDEAAWSTMRAIINKPAFDTPVPICVSELKIKANEQLSGYVSDFSGICYSKIPDWTPEHKEKINMAEWRNGKLVDISKTVTVAGHWAIKRETSNPASIMRYLLTSRHSLIKPFSTKRLDNKALVSLWHWCKKNDFRFDYICDSEENLWARLVAVLAPALAAPTTDVDGLWGAIFDSPDKSVRQLFTPRNSWNMSIQRGFARLPDALRVSFIDETDDWTKKEGFVYNDGFGKEQKKDKNGKVTVKQANDVVEWSFDGVTNWKRMYKLARYHLAQLLHRQMSVTISTDWEWLAVHRGDLVGLASDVLMNVFGTARIMRKVYKTSAKIDTVGNAYINEDLIEYTDSDSVEEILGPGDAVPENAKLVGIEIDDEIYYTAPKPARYGIAVRRSVAVANDTGCAVDILEIKPQYGQSSSILYFANVSKARQMVSQKQLNFGDLVSVSLLGEEYEEYLVASITPGDNMSAQLTLVPYKTKEIMKAANGKIPEYEAPVILDQVKGATDLPSPTLKTCVSDEKVAHVTASGSVVVCIGGTWSIPPNSENLPYFTIQMHCTHRDTGDVITGTTTNASEYAVAENAKVGGTYYCKIRITDPATGRTSGWSNTVTHTVVGLVLPPPAPENVRVVTTYPQGIKLTWDEVQVIDLRRYKITGSAAGQTRGKETEYTYSPKNQTGKLTYNVWSVDTTDHVSTKSGTASVTINPPKKPVITLARLENEGVVVTYEDAKQTWPTTTYEWTCGGKTATSTSLRAVVAPTTPVNALKVKGRARDYFLNWGEWSAEKSVTLVPPATPVIASSASELGSAVFTWQNCQTVTNISRYIVAVYVSSKVITDFSSVTPLKRTSSNSLFYSLDISTIHDDNGDNEFNIYVGVKAVDKWGLESAEGSGVLRVYPPYAPTVKVEKRTDGLYLTWNDCKRVFNIARYVVQDIDLDLEYKIDGTSQALKPRAPGLYHFAVQAVDVAGLWSAKTNLSYTVTGVEAINGPDIEQTELGQQLWGRIDGSDILLTWEIPGSSWPIDYYRIYDTALESIGRAKTTYYRFPAPVAGSYEYGVRAVDIAGNWGPQGRRVGVTINLPAIPVVKVKLNGEGLAVSWEPGDGENTLPVVAWDVEHYWEYDADKDGVASTAWFDHGRLDANSLVIQASSTGSLVDSGKTVPALPMGRHWLHVRAVDTAGNLSPEFGDAYIDIAPPGKVTFQNCSVVDNNVMLYWSVPDVIHFPIAYYLFEQVEQYEGNGETDEYYAEIGRIDALFVSTFETESGRYVYSVTPVDVAGNRGTRTKIAMEVSQPPDFILYHDFDSLFSGGNSAIGRDQPNGGKTNFVLDGEGHMLGPYADATWQENIDAIAAEKGVNAGNITWQQKVAWEWEYWLDPAQTSATYVEIVDVMDGADDPDALIPSTSIRVTIDSVTLSGNPSIACKIEVSQDGETWIKLADDALNVYAAQFRYARYTITVTGGVVEISRINYKLDVKRRSDFGRAHCDKDDNGEGWSASKPMLTGTWVTFNTAFTDVESLPRPNVVGVYDADGTEQNGSLADLTSYTAYTVFEDVLNPEGFRVFVLDRNGQRVTADVDWAAYGV